MKEEKEKSVPSVDSTENGKTRESDYSLTPKGPNVKFIDSPLDLRTEMFMLNLVSNALNENFVDDRHRVQILSDLISKCTEANEA